MSLQINFDSSGNPELSSFILAYRDGRIIGELTNISKVNLHGSLKDAHEISLLLTKENNGIVMPFWDDVTDFKIILCKEWKTWFEVTVVKNESTETTKALSLTRLGDAEMQQIKVYDTEINTENDIDRPEYTEPTIFYNPTNPDASLLHRLMHDKAQHYRIRHVDPSIRGIQRTFQFSDRTLDECFQEIEDELNVLFVYDSDTNDVDNGITVNRTISVYDMLSYCNNCGCREEFTLKCPECGSTDIYEGYGDDTIICIDSECLSNELEVSTNHDDVKTCYRMTAGDDLMTATIKSINPNGSLYVWHISDDIKKDMSETLVKKLEMYAVDCDYYQKSYSPPLQEDIVTEYNKLITKYNPYKSELSSVGEVAGYAKIMETLWNAIDLQNFLEYDLMPSDKLTDTTADEQAQLLTASVLSPIAVTKLNSASLTTVQNAVLNFAKLIVDRRYKVSINTSYFYGITWTGSFIVTNRSYPDDVALSNEISVTITEDYETYVRQKLTKRLENTSYTGNISDLFALNTSDFTIELTKYGRSSLITFNDACTSCIEILIEQGIANNETWENTTQNLYQTLYLPYLDKQAIIQEELKIRDTEINSVKDMYNQLIVVKNAIQETLDFENYLGTELWKDFSAYRREDTYSNDNFISDGLSNAEMFKRAFEFIESANSTIQKSSLYRHNISTSIKNLMVIKEFKDLKKHFKLGNWMRIKDNDGKIYKLRLLDFDINFDDLNDIHVTFSDAIKIYDKANKIQNTIFKTSSIVNICNNTIKDTLQKYESLNDKVDNSQADNTQNNNNYSDRMNDKVNKDNVVDDINSSIGSSLISGNRINIKDIFNALFTVSNVDIGEGATLPDNHIYIYYSGDENSGNGDSGDNNGGDDNGGTTGELSDGYLYSYGTTSDLVGGWNTYQYLNEAGGAEMDTIIEEQDDCLYMYKPRSTKPTTLCFYGVNPLDFTGYSTLNMTYSYIANYPQDFSFIVGNGNDYDTYTKGKYVACSRTSSTDEVDTTVSFSLENLLENYNYIQVRYYAEAFVTRSAEIKIKEIWLE